MSAITSIMGKLNEIIFCFGSHVNKVKRVSFDNLKTNFRKSFSHLITLLDEEHLAPQVPAEPDDSPHGRVHALRVAARREDGDGLADVSIWLDDPLGGRVEGIDHHLS